MPTENAEILALEALGWLAGDETALKQFLDQSGIDAPSLRAGAGTPEMAAAVLDFLLAHEELLLRFCEDMDVEPKDIHAARRSFGPEGLREI
jgi:hypothetical protein